MSMIVPSLPELREYLDETGNAPFSEWLRGLADRMARAKIRVRLDRLQLGNPGDVKPVGQGVHELRINHGPGYRIYFANDGGLIIVLLAGGTKKNQTRDIRRAYAFWRDYQRRKQ